VEHQFLDPLHDAARRTGEEARAQAIGLAAETEIEACRLDLISLDLARRPDFLLKAQRLDARRRQEAGCMKLARSAPDFRAVVIGEKIVRRFGHAFRVVFPLFRPTERPL
jgi:hypothetical protein